MMMNSFRLVFTQLFYPQIPGHWVRLVSHEESGGASRAARSGQRDGWGLGVASGANGDLE